MNASFESSFWQQNTFGEVKQGPNPMQHSIINGVDSGA